AEPGRLVEEGLGDGAGHLALEPGVEFRVVVNPPVAEERGEGTLSVDDEIAAAGPGLAHLFDQVREDLGAGCVARNRTTLGGGNGKVARHGESVGCCRETAKRS